MSDRVCAVTSCKNNGYKLQKWMNKQCDEHKCTHRECPCPRPFTLFSFPSEKKDSDVRTKWAQLINRKCADNSNWLPKKDSRVCSDHFVDKLPTKLNPFPTVNLGYTPVKEPKARPPPRRRLYQQAQAENSVKIRKICTNTSSANVQNASFSDNSHEVPSVHNIPNNEAGVGTESTCSPTESADETPVFQISDHSYACNDQPMEIACGGCIDKSMKIEEMKKELVKLREENSKLRAVIYKKSRKPFNIDSVLKSDKKVKFYTGIPSVKVFMTIFTYIVSTFKQITYWKGPSRVVANPLPNKRTKNRFHTRSLSKKEELILTMMKLRLGILNQDLADRFGISMTCVTNIITTWVRILAQIVGSLVFNPSKEVVKANLPPSFKNPKYTNTRHIIDCTEVFIQKPSSFEAQTATWSDYKHHHTLKILISITPSGMINFISNSWGGRASDKYVTEKSGFLNILEAYDTVMADRGFPIREELALRHCHLLIPPGRRGVTQMSSDEVRKTKEIANRRIYVEQAIRRLKCFRILRYEVPLTLLSHVDDIMKIVGGICNLYPPLPRYPSK